MVVQEGVGVIAREDRFAALCVEVEPRLRRALVAAWGPDVGSDAAADALAWAWEHFERLERTANPAGYLWRVGSTAARRQRRGGDRTVPWSDDDGAASAGFVASLPAVPSPSPSPEPALAAALGRLPVRQRAAVLLVHGYGYGLREAAEVLGCRVRTLRTHLDRGMTTMRAAVGVDLEVDDD